ncbi:MAG TPA: hypothetical protein VF659_06360 [Pyrinomonadaceae bacterium]|jgi:hypothetical protein
MIVKRAAAVVSRVIVIASLILSLPHDGLACSCLAPRAKKRVEGAAAAFSGKVSKVEYLDPDEERVEPRIVVTFEVYRSWKGPRDRSVVLHTVYNKWTCEGYFFKEGEEYLVFAGENRGHTAERFAPAKDTLGTSPCATKELARAEEELRELGPGRKPE